MFKCKEGARVPGFFIAILALCCFGTTVSLFGQPCDPPTIEVIAEHPSTVAECYRDGGITFRVTVPPGKGPITYKVAESWQSLDDANEVTVQGDETIIDIQGKCHTTDDEPNEDRWKTLGD